MIQAVRRALEILEYVGRSEGPASLTEIALSQGLNQATCANIIKTLVEKNYLEHLGRKKGYRLGAMAYRLTGNLSYGDHLVLHAKDIMEDLTHRFNESTLLGILRNRKRFILHIVNSDQDLQVRSKAERNIYETASGRILLAFLPDREREQLIQSIGLPEEHIWKNVRSREDLEKALATIKKAETVFTHSPQHIIGIAVPIKKKREVIASLSFYLPKSRCNAARKEELLKALKAAAREIHERISS